MQKKDPFTSPHNIKANLPHWAEFEILRNGALKKKHFFAIYSEQPYTYSTINDKTKRESEFYLNS